MSINIKNPETVRLIRELAEATGEGVTEAITNAVREKLAKVERPAASDRKARLDALIEDMASRFRHPYDTVEHGDLLYDERTGLPK